MPAIECKTFHKDLPCFVFTVSLVQVTYLPVQQNGLIDLQQLEDAIRPDTAIVSVMMVNNEIGVRWLGFAAF
jgi:cysteine sulfinate desulfinase/cysteine desulfurase-like protein